MPAEAPVQCVNDLQTPALIIYQHIVEANCNRMLNMAKCNGVNLRPHFKTTKCLEAAILQTGGTKKCMVVSTLAEATYLFENGFDDILYGVPLSSKKIHRCKMLTEKWNRFSVIIDNVDVAKLLHNTPLTNGKKWSIIIKVCCENDRAGICHDSQQIDEIAKLAKDSSLMKFQGVYAHCGETYHCSSVEEVQKIANHTTHLLLKVVERLEAQDIECEEYGVGCTPSCSNPTPAMTNLTEWHPGNYVLYDIMQVRFQTLQMCLCNPINHYFSDDNWILYSG